MVVTNWRSETGAKNVWITVDTVEPVTSHLYNKDILFVPGKTRIILICIL